MLGLGLSIPDVAVRPPGGGTVIIPPLVLTAPARVRQAPADFGIVDADSLSYFKSSASVALTAGGVMVSPRVAIFAYVGGFREGNRENRMLFRASANRITMQMIGALRPQFKLQNTSGTTVVDISGITFDHNNTTGVRKHGTMPVGGDPDNFLGFSCDCGTALSARTGNINATTTVSAISNMTGIVAGMAIEGAGIPIDTLIVSVNVPGTSLVMNKAATATTTGVALTISDKKWSLHRKVKKYNGGLVESNAAIASVTTFTPGGTFDTGTSGVIEVFGQAAGGFRDTEHALYFLLLAAGGTYFDWSALCANQAAPYTGKTYIDVLMNPTLCEVDGAGVLKSANLFSGTPNGTTTFSKPHWFLNGADGAGTAANQWAAAAGYNRGSARALVWTPSGTGVNGAGKRYARLETIAVNADWVPEDTISAARIGAASEVMRINSLYAATSDPAVKLSRMRDQANLHFFGDVVVEANMKVRFDDFDRQAPIEPAADWATTAAGRLARSGFVSKGFINPDPVSPNLPDTTQGRWLAHPSNGIRAPGGNNEKQVYLEQGDTFHNNSNIPFVDDHMVHEFTEPIADGGTGVLDLLTWPKSRLSGAVQAIIDSNDKSRIAYAGMIASGFEGILYTYGVSVSQHYSYWPSTYPRDTVAGDFLGDWEWQPYGKIASARRGYGELDRREKLARLGRGIWPVTAYSAMNWGSGGTIDHVNAWPLYKDRLYQDFFHPTVDGTWVEIAVIRKPPWIKGDQWGEYSILRRFADETNFTTLATFNIATPFASTGDLFNAFNPRVALWVMRRMWQFQFNNAFDPEAFYFDYADETTQYPIRNRIGYVAHFLPQEWQYDNANPTTSRTFTAVGGKRYRYGLDYKLGTLTRVSGGTGYSGTLTGTIDFTGKTGRGQGYTMAFTQTAGVVDAAATVTLGGYGFDPTDTPLTVTVAGSGGGTGASFTVTIIDAVANEEPFFAGTPSNDTITGGSVGGDWIHGNAGDDVISPGASGATDTEDNENRVWTGPGNNTVNITVDSHNYIFLGHEAYTGDKTKIVVPAGHDGVLRLEQFKTKVYDATGTLVGGDQVDLSDYVPSGFADVAAILAAIATATSGDIGHGETAGGSKLALPAPATGTIFWLGGVSPGDFTADNFITVPTWVPAGASAAFDFINNRYWAGSSKNLTDLMSITRATQGRAVLSDGTFTTNFANNTFRLATGALTRGLLIEGSSTNVFNTSTAPATQTRSLATGTYTTWITGSGSITLSGGATGTVTEGSPVTFTLASTLNVTFTVAGTVTYAQCEISSIVTSPIDTGAGSAVRNSDVVSILNEALTALRGSAGTVVVELGPASFSDANQRYAVSGPGANDFMLRHRTDTAQVTGRMSAVGATATATLGGGSTHQSRNLKEAFAWDGTDRRVCANGGTVATQAGAPDDRSVLQFYFGSRNGSNMSVFYARNMTIYPTKRSDADLQALTA